MQLTRGLNHVAVMTDDLERFGEFYTAVCGLDVVFTESTPHFRHAIVRVGADSWLHPVEVSGNPHGAAVGGMFERGHIDHLAIAAASKSAFEALRSRLTTRDASDGTVEDLGAFHSVWFTDPDGMHGELTLIVDAELAGLHAPTPLASASHEP